MSEPTPLRGRVMGRYALFNEIASGGMATVHFGRLMGPVGFSRTVAIKRLHPQYASDPEFVSMFLDEARLTARIRHPNVVPVIDVVALTGELLIVMEYVQGESLSRLVRTLGEQKRRLPVPMALTIVADLLYGLHAAHEAKDEQGIPLEIVHRDVSPHNVMVGHDGVSRVLDFGIAKAASRSQTTRDGQVKGKFAYMTPEQLTRKPVDRRADVFAASIILWEILTGERLFAADDHGAIVARVLQDRIEPPSKLAHDLPEGLDAIVLKGLERDPSRRYQTAKAMAAAIEALGGLARPAEIATFLEEAAAVVLERRAARLAEIESAETIADQSLERAPLPAVAEPTMQLREPDRMSDTDLSSSVPFKRTKRRVGAWIAAGVLAAAALAISFRFVGRSGAPHATSERVAPLATSPASVMQPQANATSSIAEVPTMAPSTTATTPRKSTPVARTNKLNCTPPFFFDKDGTKQFKPECL